MGLIGYEHKPGSRHEQRVGYRHRPFMRTAKHHRNVHDCHAHEAAGDEFRREMRFQRTADQWSGNRADHGSRQ